jgi:hypothetical protein
MVVRDIKLKRPRHHHRAGDLERMDEHSLRSLLVLTLIHLKLSHGRRRPVFDMSKIRTLLTARNPTTKIYHLSNGKMPILKLLRHTHTVMTVMELQIAKAMVNDVSIETPAGHEPKTAQ